MKNDGCSESLLEVVLGDPETWPVKRLSAWQVRSLRMSEERAGVTRPATV